MLTKISEFMKSSGNIYKLSSHGFRIGRCSDWGLEGLSEAAICEKGRWGSAKAFRSYLRKDIIQM